MLNPSQDTAASGEALRVHAASSDASHHPYGRPPHACERCRRECVRTAQATPGPTLTERMGEMEARLAELSELVQATSERCRCLERERGETSEREVEEKVSEDQGQTSLAAADMSSMQAIRFSRVSQATKRRRRSGTDQDREQEAAAFDIFVGRCAIAVPFLDSQSPSFTPDYVKQRSPLLFYAIVAVGSREVAEFKAFHRSALQEAMALNRATLGGAVPSIWDLMGTCIINSWLSPLRPPATAYELGLHKVPATLQTELDAERLRVWAYLVLSDLLIARATATPALISERLLRDIVPTVSTLLRLPKPRARDIRIVAQVEMSLILHEARVRIHDPDPGVQNLEPNTAADDLRVQHWYSRWAPVSQTILLEEGVQSQVAYLAMVHHFGRLYLALMCLRGVQTAADMNPTRLVHAHSTVTHGIACLRSMIDGSQPPVILYNTDYVHVNIAFVGVVLLKMIELVPNGLDEEAIIGVVKDISDLLAHLSGRSLANMLDGVLSQIEEVRDGRAALVAQSLFVDDLWPWTAETSGFVVQP
ncbi:hypothetical protein JCM24511_03733 [Saitozyma sp. JCM 24511]|nr:hypothetical protein JCM24511_03733 [Saitozyma sp. JCM 24511]